MAIVLKDWYGKDQKFDQDKIFVRDENGELVQFTQGKGEAVLESLEVTENGTYAPSEGVDGFSSVEVNVDPTKISVMKETTLSESVYNAIFGYVVSVNPTPFTLTISEKYFVKWDGVTYECVAYDGNEAISGTIYLGNASILGLPGNGEPFIIAITPDNGGTCNFICGTDTEPTVHTVSIWQKVASGSSTDVRYVTFMSYDGLTEYGKKAVAVGDDCADPIARGVFDTPTRESDAQYNYTFNGWATEPNGEAVSDWNKSITEDKTVYAAFASAVRYYTITYYDSDGTTVLKTESLAYGTTPSYVPKKSGYDIEGWNPTLTAVTGDASYIAIWTEAFVFATASWTRIAEIAESGEVEKYISLGDSKSLTFTSADGNEYTVNMVVCGINHDEIYRSDGKKAGISLIADTVAGSCKRHSSAGTYENGARYGAWQFCDLKKQLPTILSSFPTELQSVIKTVVKKSGYYDTDDNEVVTLTNSEQVWLPSATELGFSPNTNTYTFAAEGEKYAYYTRIKKDADGTAQKYWLRTGSIIDNINCVFRMNDTGVPAACQPTDIYYLAIGFCI